MDQNVKKTPLVSVTICTYNRADTIVKAIHSALQQTYENLEIIVVDDASTDTTQAVIQDMQRKDDRIKYFKNEKNLNIARSRNKTVEHAQGAFIAILDSDDYWIDIDKLKKQVHFLENNPRHAVVGTQAIQIDGNGVEIGKIENLLTDADIRENFLIKNEFVHSSVMYRKRAIEAYGFFDKNKSPFEDYDLLLKIGRKYELANLPSVSTAYRVHAGGESKNLNFKKRMILLRIMVQNIFYYKHLLQGLVRRVRAKGSEL
jgi:glycosyltransferase involved in cell wall biosynthesis